MGGDTLMNNVTMLRGTENFKLPPHYTKYEIYVAEGYESEFEAELSDKESWTWCSKTKVEVI
jgi:hypothetical protein